VQRAGSCLAFCLKEMIARDTLYIDALRRSDALAGPTSKGLDYL
jgi:hypothetical protein